MVSRPNARLNARPNAPERTSWYTPLSIFISRDDTGGADTDLERAFYALIALSDTTYVRVPW